MESSTKVPTPLIYRADPPLPQLQKLPLLQLFWIGHKPSLGIRYLYAVTETLLRDLISHNIPLYLRHIGKAYWSAKTSESSLDLVATFAPVCGEQLIAKEASTT